MGFNIHVTSPQLSTAQSKLILAARDRCSRVVVGSPPKAPADAVLKIDVKAGPLDAGLNALSEPRARWKNTSIPSRATIWLQEKAVVGLEQAGLLANIVEHEIFHCLGFGLAWSEIPHLLQKAEGEGLVFCGPAAFRQYKFLLDDAGRSPAVAGIPVEMDGAAGQAALHWRESVFGDELMSGKQGDERGKLSAMTIASLADLGYGVEMGYADAYRLP